MFFDLRVLVLICSLWRCGVVSYRIELSSPGDDSEACGFTGAVNRVYSHRDRNTEMVAQSSCKASD